MMFVRVVGGPASVTIGKEAVITLVAPTLL